MKAIRGGGRSVAMAVFGAAWMLAAIDAPNGVNSAVERGKFRCQASIDVPIRLQLSAAENTIAPNANGIIEAEVSAQAELAFAQLLVKSEGGGRLLGPENITIGPLAKGQSMIVEVPVQFEAGAAAVVHIQLAAFSADGSIRFAKNEAFYVDFRDGRTLIGTDGFFRMAMREVEEGLFSGNMTAEHAIEACRQLMCLAGEGDRIQEDVNPQTAGAPEPLAAPEEFVLPDEDPNATAPRQGNMGADVAGGGSITVQGTVRWQDENGNLHPAYGITVQVRDDELIGSELVAQMATGVNGQYFFVIDNDDGIGAGNRDIFVRFRTANAAVSIESSGILGAAYETDTAVQDEVPNGTVITENFTCANTGTGPSCGLLTGATYVAAYAAQLNGGPFLGHIVFEWPGAAGSANYDGSDINLRPGDQWDWDVLFHEYGHYVMDTFNFENNPGGPHNIGDCISNVHSSKDEGVRLAWGEGWATYFGTCAQIIFNLAALNVPRVGQPVYDDTGESSFNYSLETQDNNGIGEDNEVAVQRVLWDLFDNASDGRDTLSVSDQTLFDRVNAADPLTLSAAWAALRAPLSAADDLAYGEIVTDHLIGPALTTPANNSIVRPLANFSWAPGVGCNTTTFGGTSFDLEFYHPVTLATTLVIPGLASPNHTLTPAQYQTLLAANRQARFAVEARNGSNPATGPYLGESRLITLNRRPVADAGADRLNVECTSPAGAAVMLNGAGSSDPDGDALTYSWTAPGIVFNNPASPTPTATFPGGQTIITLTVSDGIESDSDTVRVTVVDTTAPVVVCPADITVECTEHHGNPATHPAIAAFLNSATVSDICDPTPALINDAPAFFPLGTTVVTWTATDDDGNMSTCSAKVNVVDTTPPVISFEVTPNALWAPNHRLVTVNATVIVSDICDPAPVFVLTSITVNEPDNGIGDGNTTQDVAGAAFGTADIAFQLRAERSGRGSGRVYTIRYTATDMSGNSAATTRQVTVAHDQR